MEQLDCRGLACPQPVMRSRDAVAGGAQALEVLVDNEPARENLRRFFEGRGFNVADNQEGPDCWRISATAGHAAPATQQGTEVTAATEGNSRTLVLITTETIGRGDDVLGGKLMGNFQTSSLQPLKDMKTLVEYLQPHDDLSFELYQVIEDTRFLMQKDGAMQLLGSKHLYQPCSMDILKELTT